jgi:hypothetical protein
MYHDEAAVGILVVQVCHFGPIPGEVPQRAPCQALMRLQRKTIDKAIGSKLQMTIAGAVSGMGAFRR